MATILLYLSERLSIRLVSALTILQLLVLEGNSQCLTPSDNGDTLIPVINRMYTYGPFGASPDFDRRQFVYRSAINGNTMYIGGNFQNIGPNTGTGVVMDQSGTQLISPKKWRINGPVLASLPDGTGGFYVGGAFTRVGDLACANLAHINSNGEPYNWTPQINDAVETMAIYKDSLLIGGRFSLTDGQARNGFAIFDLTAGSFLPPTYINYELTEGTVIHVFETRDSVLYVGANDNAFNDYNSFFAINLNSGVPSPLPLTYQLQDVYALAVSEDKQRIYIGGHGGGSATSNGFCMNTANGALLYTINVGVQSASDNGIIYSIKEYGKNVYAGGLFDYGAVNGHSFNQKGIIAFDPTTGVVRSYLNNCNGFISAVQKYNGSIYVGGEFTSVGGLNKTNFAIFDTTTLTIGSANSLAVSDQIRTISFNGSGMFTGGYFHSWGCVARNGLAAFDINTGEIKSWQPSMTVNALGDMKSKGDTIFMAGLFSPGGAFVAVNALTGSAYPSVSLAGTGNDLLFDGNYLYVGGADGHTSNANIVKVGLPNLNEITTWAANPGFVVRSIQKKGNKLYATGDITNQPAHYGFVSEINDNGTTATITRTINLANGQGSFYWITGAALAGNKLFISGLFNYVQGQTRQNLAVIDINSMQITPINVGVAGSHTSMQFLDGDIYLYGEFETINQKEHKYLAVIDTTVGAVFPDRLHLNNDSPFGYSLDDYEFDRKLNTVQLQGDKLFLGGNFRNVNQKMFPALAKLQMVPAGNAPSAPQGIDGPDTLQCPGQNNLYTIPNADPELRYAWFYSGNDVTIRNNGTDSIFLDAGPLASPGILKVIALNECGHSDTIFLNIALRTTTPGINATNLRVVRKTDTTATIKFNPGNGARRIVIVRATSPFTDTAQAGYEYTANNKFGLGSDIGNNSYVVYKGTGDSIDIKQLSPAVIYFVTVVEFNGSDGGTNYFVNNNPVLSFTTYATQPAVQASGIIFSNKTTNSITISCTPGSGAKRIVVLKKGYVTQPGQPADGVSYNADTQFELGSDVGNLSYVVSATTTPVTVTGLSEFTQYRVSIFEYSGSDSNSNYLLTNAPNVLFTTRANEPTVQASNIVVSNITGSGATINCTPGNGFGRIILAREDNPIINDPVDLAAYTYNTQFGIGSNIGNNTYVLFLGNPVNALNLRPGHTYYIKIFEYGGADTLSDFLLTNAPATSFTTPVTPPTTQANGLNVSQITAITAFVSVTSGNGGNRLMVMKSGSPITDVPVNGVSYSPNTTFGSGDDIGNNTYVIGNVCCASVTNLIPGVTYYIKVFEYNGAGSSTMYLLTNPPTRTFTTNTITNEPSLPATGIVVNGITPYTAVINCSPGNGQYRLIVIREGSTIPAVPLDGKSYTANTLYAHFSSEMSNQIFVLSNSAAASVAVTGLYPDADFSVSIFEFNGTGTTVNYLTTSNPVLTFRTNVATPCTTNAWTGAVNSSWEHPGNWSCGIVPDDPNMNVVITSGNIILSSNRTCRTITLQPGATLTISPGFTLTVTN